MGKAYCYELRRMVWNKFFLGLLVILAWYSRQLLTTQIILGVGHTAPFSPWSFGSYLAQTVPLLCVALLLSLWDICSARARRVETLTAATPVDPGRFLLVKCGAAVTACLLLALMVAAMGAGFLLRLFGPAVPVWSLAAPALLALVPPLVFTLGAGMAAGRAHPALLFVLMPLLLVLGTLPQAVQLSGHGFFEGYPLTLGLDPAFSVPGGVAAGRLAYLLAGLGLAAWTAGSHRRKAAIQGRSLNGRKKAQA